MGLYGRGSIHNLHKMEHTGRIQHRQKIRNVERGDKNPQNIVNYVLTSLDDSSRYKTINGKLYTKDVNFKDGKFEKTDEWISIEEHNRRHYPILQNPLNVIDPENLKTRDEILK
jgi:hypothetical protein